MRLYAICPQSTNILSLLRVVLTHSLLSDRTALEIVHALHLEKEFFFAKKPGVDKGVFTLILHLSLLFLRGP